MWKTLTSLALVTLVAAGCGSSDGVASPGSTDPVTDESTQQQGDISMITITGEVAYRERIALIPGGTATITLSDTSMQDVAAPVIAETTIELGDQQVPIPFELVADTTDLDERGTYTVRATITGPDDDLQWTTDTANPVDITRTDVSLGTLMLVRAGGAGTDTGNEPDGAEAPQLIGEWTVTEIDGTAVLANAPATLVFGDDATVGGNTGCNSFSSTYRTDGDVLVLDSEIASTLMGCEGDVSDQETAMFELLGGLRGDGGTYEITADPTTLTMTATDGTSLIARR